MSQPLFRAEALEHHAGRREDGDVLRFGKTWAHAIYQLVLAAAVGCFVFVSFFAIDEYANGPAVVRVDGRTVISATAPGTIEAIHARPGELVHTGSVLVAMHDRDEANELARASSELDFQVVRMLQDLSSVAAREALPVLRAARDRARLAADSRRVRAGVDGYVTDIRVRPGQHVNAGDVLLALAPQNAETVSLIAMLPASYRPMLRSGLRMRFELDGFRYEYSDLTVSEVSSEAVGPGEVRRLLGEERGDAVQLDPGAKVFVSARIPTANFTSDGHPYGYYDGLTGTAEICVRRETILISLIPALRQWFR
jgi:membrane fusion protein (multidrug efflux system)